jgi:hypothetical protein
MYKGYSHSSSGNEMANDDGKVVACSSVNYDNKPADKQALLF